MGEAIYVCYRIGGKATATVWQELMDLSGSSDDDCLAAAKQKRCLEFGGEYNYGENAELEALCQKHNLTYTAEADGKYEYMPEVRTWKPGWDDEIVRIADTDHNPIVNLPELRVQLAFGKSLADVVAELSVGDLDVPPVEIIPEEESADA